MSTEFKVPKLGENVNTVSVVKILVSKGDKIEPERPVIELETDKAVLEVVSDVQGTIDEIQVKVGDDVHVGQTLFTVSSDGAKPEVKEITTEAKPKAQPEVKPETQSTTTPDPKAQESHEAEPAPQPREPIKPAEPVAAAPSVRRFAREIGIDIQTTPGSGPMGRITIEDVKAYARRIAEGRPASDTPATGRETALPDFAQWGEVERKPMSKVRRLTAERMTRAWTVIPHVTQFAKADVTDIEALRQRYKADAEQVGGRMTLSVVLLKTVVGALKHFPQFNASVDLQRNELIHKKYYNVGVAMDTDRGLMVPVLRGVDGKNLMDLSVELNRLTTQAREGKLTLEDLRGGCFTITNAGALGGDIFTPIINWPEVAILGLGQTRMEAVYREGDFKPRLMLPLSLSYDHRVIDGADGVRFIRWIVAALEEPVKFLWEGGG